MMIPFADAVRAALPVDPQIGREILVFEETDSTNDLASRAGYDGAAEGLAIFAEAQRAGRGRLGRRWASPPARGLLLSLLLRPPTEAEAQWPELTFCAALAVAETAETHGAGPAQIKWPNDVVIAGRKFAGILVEVHRRPPSGFVVVGIGLNVLQRAEEFAPELRGKAVSLAMATQPDQPEPNRAAVAATLLTRFGRIYQDWPANSRDVRSACAQRGCAGDPETAAGGMTPEKGKGGP